MRPAAVMLHIYRALLHELLARGWRRLDEPVRIPARRKLALVLAMDWRDVADATWLRRAAADTGLHDPGAGQIE